MIEAYQNQPKRLRDLNGFGPKSEEILARVGIYSPDEFMATDPYLLYEQLVPMKGIGLNSIYAIIGARENRSWIDVKNSQKTEILFRLDDMGIAPK